MLNKINIVDKKQKWFYTEYPANWINYNESFYDRHYGKDIFYCKNNKESEINFITQIVKYPKDKSNFCPLFDAR